MGLQRSLLTLAFFAYGVNAQAPGGGQAGGAQAQTTSSGDVVTTGTHFTQSALPTETTGPWSDTTHLEGTWVSKSQMVMTGPDFYDPVDELLIEPALPGMSYSFTSDGFFEEAVYQVTANPSDPKCATGALTFQHGTYNVSDGKLKLYPFETDGRQLVSDPCNSDSAEYVQYSQQETFSEFSVQLDLYYGRYRLNLYQWDGTPLAPLYLVYRPPQMLPTVTMNPVLPTGASSTSSSKKRSVMGDVRQRIKRSLQNRGRSEAVRQSHPSQARLWWAGVAMMAVGTVGFITLS